MTDLSSRSSDPAAAAGKTLIRRAWPFLVAAAMIAYVIALLFLVMNDMATTSTILRGQ